MSTFCRVGADCSNTKCYGEIRLGHENNGFARCPQIDSKDEIGYMKNIMPNAPHARI
jgi:hypothetical protein